MKVFPQETILRSDLWKVDIERIMLRSMKEQCVKGMSTDFKMSIRIFHIRLLKLQNKNSQHGFHLELGLASRML